MGQLEVSRGDVSIAPTAPKQRALLALLVLRDGETVTVDHILDSLWGDDLPTKPQRTLRFHVSKLRSALRSGGVTDEVIETIPGGYRLPEDGYELDAREFDETATAGADILVSDPMTASKLLTEAESLWRGPALVDFSYDEFAQPAIRRLTSERLVATEDLFEAQLRMGRGAELVPDLEAHTGAYPFRERAWGQLMVARYRAGDTAGALRAYQEARTALGESLGIEPGPELQDLEESVLQNRSEILGRVSYVAPVGSLRVRLCAAGGTAPADSVVEAWGGHIAARDEDVIGEFEGIASALSAAADLANTGATIFIGSPDTTFEEARSVCGALHSGQVALAMLQGHGWNVEPARVGLMSAPAATAIEGYDVYEAIGRARPVLDTGDQPSISYPTAALRGRSDVLDQLADAISPGRVVSVVGPGGVGKTRLALEAARRLGDSSRVALVKLATIDAAAVPAAILASLGAVPKEATTMEAVVEAIGLRPLLLVFDNCEHLLDTVASAVETITEERDNVAVLCTSLHALEVPAERVITLEPLPTEGVDSPAVEMFVDRLLDAGGAEPGPAESSEIADVCRLLDGVPLAIELAATRAASMPASALREAVATSTSFLRRRTSEDRHATLTATITWSMDLLDDRLHRLFTDLAVFRGAFRPESAAAVVGDPDSIDLDLAELAAWSLIHSPTGATVPTYEMLTIVREHVSSMIDPVGLSTLQEEHVAFYQDRAHRAGEQSRRKGDDAFEDTVSAEFDNYRSAFNRSIEEGDLDSAIAIVDGLLLFAMNRIRFEVHDWAQTTTELDGFAEHPRSAQIHGIVALGAWLRGDLDAAATAVRNAFAAETRLGLGPTLASRWALTNLIAYAAQVNRLDEIADLAAQGDERFRELVYWARETGDPYWLVVTLSLSATGMAVAGDSHRAVDFATRSLAAARESGATSAIAWSELAMGLAQLRLDRATATHYLDSCLDRTAESGNRYLYGVTLGVAAGLQLEDEGPHVAASSILDLIVYWHDYGNDPQFWHAIGLAAIALHQVGEDDPAASLLAATRRSSGYMPLYGIDPTSFELSDIEPGAGVMVPWTADEAAAMAKKALVPLT